MTHTFGVVRLGKDSVEAIKNIDSFKSLSVINSDVQLECSQVSNDLVVGSIIFIWLGSDNSKGVDTAWEKGLRAIGILSKKTGGPSYKDHWSLTINIQLVLPRSISHRDYLNLGSTYEAFSDIPVLGLNTYSNQLAQYISPSPRKDVRALLYAISSLVAGFESALIRLFPSLELLLDFKPDITDTAFGNEATLEELEYPEGLMDSHDASYSAYPLDSIFVRSEPRTVFEVLRRITGQVYIMNPSFQRDFVWDDEKQSKFIESVLMRIPLPPFYLSERIDGKVVVVDGLQRLTTFQRFVSGKLKLKGLTGIGQKFNENGFNDLPPILKTRIEDAPLTIYLIDAKVTERARLDIFERVNSGVPLTRQQMRNALYNGPATDFLKDATTDLDFLAATGKSLQTKGIKKDMRDREIINRFCSFLLLGPDEYQGDLDMFLGKGLERMNESGASGVNAVSSRLSRAMRNNFHVFGRHAFRKHTSPNQARSVINVALFEVMSIALADAEEQKVKDNASALQRAFYRLMHNTEFRDAISVGTADISRVRTRFLLAQIEIGAALND